MDVEIRDYRAADRDRVRGLADRLTVGVASWRDPAAVRTAVRGWIDDSTDGAFAGRALVAELDGQVVGFLSLSTTGHFGGETDGYIGELMVDEACEGHGIGRALVAAAERLAAADGHRCLTLTTGAANDRAIAFYERHGFVAEDVKLTKVLR